MSELRVPATPAGRSGGRRGGNETRERMLDAAEELFARHGFHGTSLRDVASASDAGLALVTYHFVTKDALFERVVERRSSYMGMRRIEALDAARNLAPGAPVPVRLLVEGYVWPFIERSQRGGPGWKNYAQLIARLTNSPQWAKVISEHYDAVARQYLIEFRRSLPGTSEATLYHAFSFMVGTMMATVAEPRRVETLSLGKVKVTDLEMVFKAMLPFLEAGFLACPAF